MITMSDSEYAGQQGTPDDFNKPCQSDPEHLDRATLATTQVDGTHYLGKAMQPWDIIEAYGLDFFEGNVLKYLLRYKPGVLRIIDLRKAHHYIEKCIAREEQKTA